MLPCEAGELSPKATEGAFSRALFPNIARTRTPAKTR